MNTKIVFGFIWIALAANSQTPLKIGCDSCPSSLLIMPDANCALRVDGQDLGNIAEGATKLVRVDVGEHVITAKVSDLNWEAKITIEKAVQTVVKTDFSRLRAATELQNSKETEPQQASARWAGVWFGETYYTNTPSYTERGESREV